MMCEEVGPRVFDIKCLCGAQFVALFGTTQAEEICARHLRAADKAAGLSAGEHLDPATERELLGMR